MSAAEPARAVPCAVGPSFSRLREAAGALGDLGVFIPLAVAMVQVCGLHAAAILVTAGVANLATGLVFGIPVVIQPMKALCALAIAGALTAPQVQAAGLFVGLCSLAAGALGLVRRLSAAVPRPVIGGIQLAVAFQLAASGWTMTVSTARPVALGMLAVVALGLLAPRRRPEWLALTLAAGGLAAAAHLHPELMHGLGATVWRPEWSIPRGSAALAGVVAGGVPQLALTVLNSMLAVSALAGELFPDRRRGATPGRFAVSLGLMNLITCPLGGLPVCHGSGGLAAQARMGGRTGLCTILLGGTQLVLGLFFGAAALAWMSAFPRPVLGVFLLFAALTLARASRSWQSPRASVVAVAVVATQVLCGSLVAGFVAGMIAEPVCRRAALRPRRGALHEAVQAE